jgi:hypothetical protein
MDGPVGHRDPMAVACRAALEQALKRFLATSYMAITDGRHHRLDNVFRQCVSVLGVQLEPRDPSPIILQPEKSGVADAHHAEREHAPATMVELLSMPVNRHALGRRKGCMLITVLELSSRHMWLETTLEEMMEDIMEEMMEPALSAAACGGALQPTLDEANAVKAP